MIQAFETFLLVRKDHFRMMYNSLLGWASVNHLHFHCYCFPHELVLDDLKLIHLSQEVHMTDDNYPLPGFALFFERDMFSISRIAAAVSSITDILHRHGVAHNMVITNKRCYIFPRKNADTAIVSQCVDPACVELSGQFPCKAEDEWKSMDGQKAVDMISSVQIDPTIFSKIKSEVVALCMSSWSYSASDFISTELEIGSESLSPLDQKIITSFEDAMKAGVLRYQQPKGSNSIKEVVTKHGLTMVAEWNHNRGFNKRARVEVPTINQPFDAGKFNFNKIGSQEILFKFQSSTTLAGRGSEENLAIVNISPINWCHCLYVIEPKACLPQRLNSAGVRVGFDLMRLSNHRGFRVMFNSLWAWASVNHLHLHSMYVDRKLGMDDCPSVPCSSSGLIRKLAHVSHLPGYVLNMSLESTNEKQLELIVALVEELVNFFHQNEIPYNCCWARGSDQSLHNPKSQLIRLFIWPRASAAGFEPHPAFDNACAELEGHLPIKLKEEFDNMTGDRAEELMQTAKLDEKTAIFVNEFIAKL